jgi:hypothetical protein
VLRRSNPWLFLLLIAHPLTAQEGRAAPDSLAPADSLVRADSLTPADSLAPPVSKPAPDRAALVEAGAPSGYDVSPHGYRGLDVGHLNRVDGWAPSIGFTLLPVRPNALPTLDIAAGVRTNRLDEPWGRLAASQIFAGLDRFQLAAELYRDTRTPDGWKVGARENDVWVFLTRTDLRNYYDAAGVRLAASSSDLRPWGVTLASSPPRASHPPCAWRAGIWARASSEPGTAWAGTYPSGAEPCTCDATRGSRGATG